MWQQCGNLAGAALPQRQLELLCDASHCNAAEILNKNAVTDTDTDEAGAGAEDGTECAQRSIINHLRLGRRTGERTRRGCRRKRRR